MTRESALHPRCIVNTMNPISAPQAHPTLSRTRVRDILATVLTNEHNLDVFSRRLANASEHIVHEVLYELSACQSIQKRTLQEMLCRIRDHEYGWTQAPFDQARVREEEEESFLLKPLEIEEGVLECRCGSKRTISYQRQTRSADEGSTTFARCVECGASWRHHN